MKWTTRRFRVLDGLVYAACLTGTAVAQMPGSPPASDPETWEVQSVRELMQRDIEQSLVQARQRPSPSAVIAGAPGGQLAPRLVAMYGVGRALMAEVLVGPQAYLYMRGQAHPVGYVNDQTVYQLRGMNGSCIELQRAQTSHSLCLHAMLEARRP